MSSVEVEEICCHQELHRGVEPLFQQENYMQRLKVPSTTYIFPPSLSSLAYLDTLYYKEPPIIRSRYIYAQKLSLIQEEKGFLLAYVL